MFYIVTCNISLIVFVYVNNWNTYFVYRKIQLDYGTHLNVSVILQKDNKARIGASLDRNDKTYYACAGGCIEIVPLRYYFYKFVSV